MLYPVQNEVRNRLDMSDVWDFAIDPDMIGAGAENGGACPARLLGHAARSRRR